MPAAAAGQPGVRSYTVARGALEPGPAGGLTPEELASVYGYDPAAGGSGQTIALVDAYDDPAIESDLAAFDTEYGIAACTKANGCFTKVSQTGSPTALPTPDKSGWSVEVSLDVEVAHSVCPKCKILLVEAKNETFKNLAAAVGEAVSLGATEVSNSYGGPEGVLGSGRTCRLQTPRCRDRRVRRETAATTTGRCTPTKANPSPPNSPTRPHRCRPWWRSVAQR